MSTGGANPFAAAARQRKVALLVRVVDDFVAFCGLDPKADGFAVADMLAELPVERWNDLALEAEVIEPSALSRELVVAHYREIGRIAQGRVAS